jgi:hypothetical protein
MSTLGMALLWSGMVLAQENGGATQGYTGITQVRGFAAINASTYHGEPVGFELDELVFWYSSRLDERFSFNSELAFEPEEEGVAVDLETLQFHLPYNEKIGLIAGRIHAPWTWWAYTAMHGAYRFTPIELPEVMGLEDHGGGMMPIHQIGAWGDGALPLGLWQLNWTLGVSNGRSPLIGSIAQSGDWSWNKALMGRLTLEAPNAVVMGLGGYHDRIVPGEAGDSLAGPVLEQEVSEDIVGYHLNAYTGRVEVNSEGYLIRHTDEAGEVKNNAGAFLVLGLPYKRVTPYTLVDLLKVDEGDPIYSQSHSLVNQLKSTVGTRVDIGLRVAVKVEGDVIVENPAWMKTSAGPEEVLFAGHAQLSAGF